MKRFQFILLWIVSGMLLSACKDNNELYYPEDRQAINIWFGTTAIPSNNITYNFAYTLPGRDSIFFHYRLTGYPMDTDVEFQLEAHGSDQDLVYYDFGRYVIRAGQYQGTFPIYIDKPEIYHEFVNTPGQVTFRLKETEALHSGANGSNALNVLFRNALVKPAEWDSATHPYLPHAQFFGTYSDVKYSFMISLLDMVDFRIVTISAQHPDPYNTNIITSVQATLFRNMCRQALAEYVAINGPLRDENNNIVAFP